MPWTGLMYNFDGDVKNCIRSAEILGNIKDNTIEEIVSGDINHTRQLMMLDGLPPTNCKPCQDLEVGKNSFDVISDRKFYIRELKQIPPNTYHASNFELHTIDIRWTNLCNFACAYCGPRFSSRWAEELKIKQDIPTDLQRTDFKEYIFKNARQLKHVYLAGGEPLLMKENLELLDLLDSNVNLRINTNLSKVDTQVFDRVCEFKNVHWIVSVETIEQEYEYIRHGGKWADFLDNLNIIKTLNHKISFNMLHFLLNYQSIFGCIDYLKAQGFHNNSFIAGPLLQPEYLNVRHLPRPVLDGVKQILINRIANKPGYLLEDSYINLLNYINQPWNKTLADSFNQIATLDQRRNLDSSKIFKDLYEYC